jgi:sialate O-acetylesterase
MVVQQKMKVPVWGWADPGEQVTVTLGASKATAAADADGKWMVRLDPLPAGGPLDMTVTGKNALTVKNVLAGEVYIASGQSNMEFSVNSVRNRDQEVQAANYPNIRMFTVQKSIACAPQTDCRGSWAVCSPATVPGFSAVAYFFAVNLQKALNVPIGIIHTSWGGTPVQSWTDRQSLVDAPALKPMADAIDGQFAAFSKDLAASLHDWLPAYEKAVAAGRQPPLAPPIPLSQPGPGTPTGLYNAMIAPLIPYGIAGAIWYQGESNAGNAPLYRTQFPAMIKGWRRLWGQGDFPFFWVQLANFMQVKPEPSESGWAELREAQTMTLALPRTGMATIIDLGEAGNIHPTNKQDVGLRLALAAEKVAYGMEVVYSGPLYAGMKVEGDKVIISFTNVDGGLEARGGEPLKGFAVCGEDKKYVWADARIEGETVVVSSPQVPKPVAVRYAWADNPICNLYNKAGLPAVPFRTDGPAQEGRQ